MPDNLQGDIRTGFDSNTIFDMKMDTYRTMNDVLNRPSNPYYPAVSGHQTGTPTLDLPEGMTYEDALQSTDPKIRDLGVRHLEQETQQDPYFKLGLADEIRTPYEKAQKYIDKKFGFDATIPDIEDYYYRNDYMKENPFKRYLITNPLRFAGRVIIPAVLKLGEGLGYVGSMLTSVGSDNYWADVADNAFSKWLEGKEQSFKDHVIPIYHQAGFDEKGFFSQLTNYAFWTEDVADGVAFMASAAIPGMGFAKLGMLSKAGKLAAGIAEGEEALNAFGKAFSATNKLGKLASGVGMGSPAQLASWTFNTAMEASMEGSGVFKDGVAKMKQLRARGVGEYANMTDEDIRLAAGKLASNTVGANFLVLGLSNAWENTLFFAPFKNHMPSLKLGSDFLAQGSKKGLSRGAFYGKIAAEGFLAEGLWEENAQLAVQRMNSLDDEGNPLTGEKSGLLGFLSQLKKQTIGAFTGDDPEAMKNIGVGGLIGILGGAGFTKLGGERKELLSRIDQAVDESRALRNNLFSVNDVYERDKENNIIFKDGNPVVSPTKLQAKKEGLENLFGKLQLSTLDDFQNSTAVDVITKKALGEYISSLYNMGIKDVSERFFDLSAEQAALFGISNAKVRDKAGEYGVFAKKAEQEVIRTEKENLPNPGLSERDYVTKSQAAKSEIYNSRIQNIIFSDYINKEESKMLSSLNSVRTLSNTSLSTFPVEQINSLKYQLYGTQQVINDPSFKDSLSEVEQGYHIQREKELTQQIEDFKKDNATLLEDSRQDSKGYYIAQHRTSDSKLEDAPINKDIILSNQKRANYVNILSLAQWKESNLLSKDWHPFYEKLKNIPIIQKIKEQLSKEQQDYKNSLFSKYTETQPGDFRKVVRLVGSIVEGKTEFSPEELQLQQNYAKLVEELIPHYTTALKSETQTVFRDKLDKYTKLRDELLSAIFEKKYKVGQLSVSAQTLTETLLNRLKEEGKVNIDELQRLIYATQKSIDTVEDSIKADEEKLQTYDRQLSILEEETQAGDFQGIRNTITEIKKEKEWIEKEIVDKKSLLDRLVGIIKDITNWAYKLFADAKGNYFVSRKNFNEQLSKGAFGAVEGFNEIALKTLEKNALEKDLTDLSNTFNDINNKLTYYQGIINDAEQAVLKIYEDQLKILTRQAQVIKSSTEERQTTDSFEGEMDPPGPSNMSSNLGDDFDGDDYLRPLVSKFITSTFTDKRVKDKEGNIIGSDYDSLSQAEKDHFDLMEYLSSGKNTAEINKKLGKGKLKVITVTRHNIEALGLKDLLYTKNEKNDQAKYWEDKNDADVRIDFVHVIQDGKKMFFVDKELNKLGEVGQTDEDVKVKIVRTIMRRAAFSSKEESQYDVQQAGNKNWENDKKKVLAYGLDQRKKIMASSEKFTYSVPTGVFGFTVTRGVPVRAERVDGKMVKNPVTKVLLSEDQIGANTIVVTTTGKYTLNGDNITLPVGRAYIRTGGIFERLHYADNNKLDDNTVNTILSVFDKLSAGYVARLEEVMAKQLNGKKLSELSYQDRMKMVVAFNKTTKGSFNKNYLRYLNSVTYFGLLEKDEKPSPNKIYLKGTYIHFGQDAKIDISEGGFATNAAAKQFLSRIHHNVRYYANTKTATRSFTEFYLDGTELKERTWKSYNHYLLSAKLPDGKEREFIPITTNIHTPEQASLEKNNAPGTYTSQSVILNVPYAEAITKKESISQDDVPDDLEEGSLDDMEEVSVNDLLSGKASLKKKKVDTKPKATGSLLSMVREKSAQAKKEVEKVIKKNPNEPNTPFLRNLLKMQAEKDAAKKQGENTERTQPDEDVDWGPGDSPYRIVVNGFFKTEEDLDAVIDYARTVLPQFPVERLKKAIQVSPTVQAFGMFTGDAIRLWEGAERGTLYHEIFEGVANRLLSDYEWNSILKEFRSRKNSFVERETGNTISYSKATPQQAKEEIAEEFRTFKMTGKIFEGAKNTRTFFQVILDFIRNLFNHRVTIEGLFKDIDESKLASRTTRESNRFFENYRKEYPIPYRKYNEFLQGFTSFMFRDIFETPESIVRLDEVGEIDKTLYDRIRARIDDEYIKMMQEFEAGAFPTDTPDLSLNEINKKKEKLLMDVVNNWDKIKENWGDFVINHKFYLRKFRVKFDEEYQLPSDEDDNSNRNDYSGSGFEVSNKNSSSLSTRFLVGTLTRSVVQKAKDGKFTTGIEQILPNLGSQYSSSRLPQLENYDRMMAVIANKFANLNDMELVERKLKDLAGITRLEEAATIDEQQEIASTLTSDEAAFSILYVRLFSPKKVISEEAMWNLRSKFLSYTSKQSPNPKMLMMQDGANISLIDATNRSSYEKFHKRLRSAMSKNINTFFTTKKENGIKSYIPKEKKTEIGANYFLAPEDSTQKTHFGNFLKFLGLYNPKTKTGVITPEFLNALKEEDIDKFRQLVKSLHDIGERIQTVKPFSGDINVGNLDIFGYTNNILAILDELSQSQSERLMTHLDGNNNSRQNYIPPSFTSRVLSEMSNVNNLGELIEAYPHLKQHVFLQNGIYYTDSIMIQRMFNEDGTRKAKVLSSLDYIDGIKSFDDEGGKFKKTAQLERHQRLGLNFTLNLLGYYNALTADSETEWLFNMGEFVSYEDYLESDDKGKNKIGQVVSEFYIPKLEAEIHLALSFNSNSNQLNQIHPETGYKIGQSLRFFKDILQYNDKGKTSGELVDKIHEDIQNGKQAAVIIAENRAAIRSAIRNYIQHKTIDTFNNLLENRVINEIDTKEGGTVYKINSLATELQKKFGEYLSLTQMRDMVMYGVVNSHIGNFEQFKLIYGDVAQYKDWEKRVKSLFGPIEQAYYDRTGYFNNWLNNNKNYAEFEGDRVAIPQEDIFNTSFKNSLIGRTLDDVMTVNPELLNTLYELGAKFDAYEDTNEVDGQSISSLHGFRHLMMKAAGRWTKEFEEFFQYDSALARKELADEGIYTYPSKELQRLDNRIVDKYKDNPPTEGPSPLKTLIPSVRPDGTQDLMKHSVYPNSWQLARNHPELRKLYVDMLTRGDDLLNFKSAHKVGTPLDSENNITSHYKRYGKSFSPFETTDLNEAGNIQYELSFRTLGIQVETQGGGKNQRIGSQLTKDINLNLMPNGVPADFRKKNIELAGGNTTESELIHAWNALSEEAKMTSDDYRRVQNTIKTLENLKDKSVMDTFDRIGIGYSYEDGAFKYSSVDLVKLQQHIMDEMTRLDIDDNVLDGMELTADMQAFLHPSESLPSYNVVSNIVWALSDKSISALKVNGVPYIQVSSVFFNDGQREAAYKENGKWIRVTNKEDFDRLQKEGKKLVLTSSDLKFYSLEVDGKEIQGMEVKLPHIYRKKINNRRRQLGLSNVYDEELMSWLNKNPKLLEGIGFRIPTQATSSIEFFTIKGFLPESFGKAVVVPSDITAKAGSDFDVDKLQTYLNNWKLNKDGMPVYESFKDDTNSTLQQRYDTIYTERRRFFKTVEKILQESYEKEILNPTEDKNAVRMMDAIFGERDDVSFYDDNEIKEVLKERGFDIDYNKLLKEVQDEMKKAPTLEEFGKLPIHLQNTRGSVENQYFDSIRDILRQPERFLQLLSPNNMDNIKENRDAVQIAMNPDYKSEDKKELNYSNFLDINYLTDKRHSFIRGKYDIAIFAVNMTNYANSQITGLGITQGQVRKEDEYIMEAVGYDISLPFEEAPLLKINGWDFIPLGYEKSSDGRYVMDKISGYINGAVDVAKDPVIIEMGMHSDIAGIYMLLERAGIKGKNIALYLMQPSIRDYMREVIFWKNPEFGNSSFEWKKEIRGFVLNKYSIEGKTMEYDKVEFNEEQLAAMLRKGEKIRQEQAMADERERNGKPRGKVTEWTDEEKRLQWLAFVNFLKMDMFANNMNDVRTSSNHDTAKIRSNHALTRKDLIRDRTYEGNLIMAPTTTGFENGANAMRKGTFIQKTINLLNIFNDVFTNTNLFALQNSNPKDTLDKVARRIYKRNPYMKEDDFNNIMKEYDAAIIDTLLNNYAKVGNVHISELKNQFFLPTEIINGVTKHSNNLFQMFDRIRDDDKYKSLMNNNFFMNNLKIEMDEKLGVYTIELDKTLERNDVLSRNLVISGWREIIESTDEQLEQFGKALLYGTVIQYGVKPQRNSLTPLIPLEYYSQISTPIMENIQQADFTNFDEEVVRENAYKKNFVNQVQPMAMDYVDEEGKINNIWSNRKEDDIKNNRKPTLTQRTFVRYMSNRELRKFFGEEAIATRYTELYAKQPPAEITNEIFRKMFKEDIDDVNARMISRPVFLWQKYMEDDTDIDNILEVAQEYVAVKMPRPEYVVLKEKQNRDSSFSLVRDINKIAKDMIDKKDYSWSFLQVYKLVGLDGSKPSVLKLKESTKGKSKGKVSMALLYKPVNSAGDFGFNEVASLQTDDNGNVIGKPSILKSNITVQERTDEDIVNMIRDKSSGLSLKFIKKQMEEIKTEQEAPVATSERKKKDLGITVGKTNPALYSWSRRSPNGYEVSSKGDRRFSAFFAKLTKGTLIDLPGKPEYVLEKDATIEEIYQIGVKGYKSVNQGKGKAPLTGITRAESWQRYKELWQIWSEQNPDLIDELAEKAKGKVLTDQFATTDINQARALSEILNEKNPPPPDGKEPITPTC